MKLEWAPLARTRFDDILAIITNAQDSNVSAKWLTRLHEATTLIETFPTMHPLSSVPTLAPAGIREIAYENYRVFYSVHEDVCRIISILHGHQDVTYIGDL